MKNNIYQAALKCKRISDERMDVDIIHAPYGRLMLTDYTVKGANEDYLSAVGELWIALKEEFPEISYNLRLHQEQYGRDKIVHYTAMKAIIECVLALEKRHDKKIFISHSSKDRDVVAEFVDGILQLGVGLSPEDVFCTSIEEMGIKNGEEIRNHIRDNVQAADFSFLMISKNYKESEICLNEMGAVWATDNRVRYYLLPDVDFSEIGWLCDVKKADRLCDSVVLDSLEGELTGYYGLPHKGVAWSRQRQRFLDYLGRGNE